MQGTNANNSDIILKLRRKYNIRIIERLDNRNEGSAVFEIVDKVIFG